MTVAGTALWQEQNLFVYVCVSACVCVYVGATMLVWNEAIYYRLQSHWEEDVSHTDVGSYSQLTTTPHTVLPPHNEDAAILTWGHY